jgi:hypothetical protein
MKSAVSRFTIQPFLRSSALVVVSMVTALAAVLITGGGPAAALLPSPCRGAASLVTCTFSYNGNDGSDGTMQSFVVPGSVSELTIEAWGAQGGDVGGGTGGPGGYVSAVVGVHPNESLVVNVGGHPTGSAGGFNGGGATASPADTGAGGGASDVRTGANTLAHRIVVAGGGGGSASSSAMGNLNTGYGNDWSVAIGGDGGGTDGAVGLTCTDTPWQGCGGGATASAGGAVGTTTTSPCGTDGSEGVGGSGCGGGGGGGYEGGGGGGFINGDCCELAGITLDGPGGGGSGFVTAAATGIHTGSGLQFGNGLVRISYRTIHRYPGLTWSAPVPIDTTSATVTSISCPTPTFCVAVDSGGNAATDEDGQWSAFAPEGGTGASFTSVSCSSTTFCMAVGSAPLDAHDGDDLAVIDDNGVWSANTSVTVAPGEFLTSVSCAPGTELCDAVGWANSSPGLTAVSQSYNGQVSTAQWGMGYGSSGDKLTTVSCASPTFCVTGGIVQERADVGDFLGIGFHGKGGGGQITNEQTTGLEGELDGSSCAGDHCHVSGDGAFVFTVTRSSWSGPSDPDGPSGLALSCTTSKTCVGVDANGDVLTDQGGMWSAPVDIDPGQELTAVSCPTTRFCAAVDSAGNVLIGS